MSLRSKSVSKEGHFALEAESVSPKYVASLWIGVTETARIPIRTLYKHSTNTPQTLHKHSTNTLQTLYTTLDKQSTNTLQTLYKTLDKHSTNTLQNTLQTLYTHSTNTLQTLYKQCHFDRNRSVT